MAIEAHQTKRKIVYRVVVPTGVGDAKKVLKTFRTKAAAEAWEREQLEVEERGGERS